MTGTEHIAQKPSSATGPLVQFHAFLGTKGKGASSPLHGNALVVSAALLVLFSLLAFLVPPAFADTRIGGENSGPGSYSPGGFAQPAGIAVSKKEAGDIYVLDGQNNQRVSEFTPAGGFVRAFGWGIVPSAATGSGDITIGSTSIVNVTTTTGSFNTAELGAGKIISGPGIPPNDEIAGVNSVEIRLTKPATASVTGAALAVAAGPGNVPTNEQQSLAVAATHGEFKLTFISPNPGSTSLTTAPIPFNATAEEVETAIGSLPTIGTGNVSVSEGPGDEKGEHPYLIGFRARYADTNVRQLIPVDVNLTGGSPTSEITVTTPREGGGALETCTTVCAGASAEEGRLEEGQGVGGSAPGQLNEADEIAVDNDPGSGSYGDIYVADQRNFRVEKFSPSGEFILMFGGEVDKTTHADLCTAADLAGGDTCGAGVPGTGPSHFYREEPETEAGGRKSWSNRGSNSIAVGPDGTVYVGDYGRIEEFQPNGTFSGEFSLPVGAGEEPQFVASLAVDSASNIFERSDVIRPNGESLLSQVAGVREYDASHTLIRTFDQTGEPAHIALDSAGDLFLSGFEGGEFQFSAFKPAGALYAVFTSDLVDAFEFIRQPAGIAVGDNAGNLYATASLHNDNFNPPFGGYEPIIAAITLPVEGPPTVAEEHVTDIKPTTATLHAVVNPKGFDTHYKFEYVDQNSFEHEGGFASPHTQSTASVDLVSVNQKDPVSAAISNLSHGTVYHFRLVAESECNGPPPAAPCIAPGPDQTFESLPPISVRNFTTQTVGPELVQLKAELNPNGSATSYTICYGEDTSYTGGCSPGILPVGNEFIKKEVTFTGLEPNTTYHYQLIAHNGNGDVETADQIFTTELSPAEVVGAESCPNTNLREENNSLALSDCRAYEQVSPTEKGGGQALGPSLAPSGERVQYLSGGAFAGATSNEFQTDYLAHRTTAGWLTQPALARVAPVGYEPTPAGFGEDLYSAELDRWLFFETPVLSAEEGRVHTSTGYYSEGLGNGTYIPRVTPDLTLVEGHPRSHFEFSDIVGQSEDLSKLYILTSSRLLPSPADPRPDLEGSLGANRIYEISGAGGPEPTIQLAAEVPLSLSGNNCQIDSIFGDSASHPAPAVAFGARLTSADGSTLVYAAPVANVRGAPCGADTPNPTVLFARIDAAAPIQLNVPPPSQCHSPHPCASAGPSTVEYDGVSPDGSRAWFVTNQPLIDSDTDTTNDLYFAKLEGGHLAELVQASAGQATPTHPTPGQGAGIAHVDKISQDGSRVSFVATGVLTDAANAQGQSAAQGADNLYVYDAVAGETKFVTRLCSASEVSGSVADPACPAGLISAEGEGVKNDSEFFGPRSVGTGTKADFTLDGRYLLFSSWGRLASGDTDGVRDIYRYDFQSGQLIRISFGHNGNDGNGNDDAFPALIDKSPGAEPRKLAEDISRSISADGSAVIFKTAAPLVSHDTNAGTKPGCENGQTGCDVYEWEEQGHGTCDQAGGCISLVTDGVDPNGSPGGGIISSSGRDIVFETARNLIPADTDGVGDIYDARVEGGFHTPHGPPVCTSAEGCHGSASPEPTPPNISTPGFVGPGNAPKKLHCGKGRHRVTRHGQVRCVPNKHRKHSHKKHKRANTNRGGGQ